MRSRPGCCTAAAATGVRWVARSGCADSPGCAGSRAHAADLAERVFRRLVASEDDDEHATVRVAARDGVIALRGTEFAEADDGKPRRIHAASRKAGARRSRRARGQLPVRRECASC